MKLQGIFVAAATPFDYKGDLYKVKVEHNIARWNLTSVSGYAFGCAAGEGPLLRESEKIALWEMAAKYAAPGKLLIADCTAASVEASAFLAGQAAALGFHAALCSAPYALDTAMLYFRSVADRSPIPLIVENAPESIQHPNVAAVIETPVTRTRDSAAAGITVLAGSSVELWESFEKGASGALLPLASAVPYACITLWEAFRTREREAGLDWQAKITHPSSIVTDLYGVPALKYAMELNGYYGGPPRLPFCPPGPAMRQEIETAFRHLRG
jgi:4-hydroxy-2-oxoglutarate aldolase